MRTGTDRPLATVHRLRPRMAAARVAATTRATEPAGRAWTNVIDISRARVRRRPFSDFQPPEGTAA